MDASDEAYFNNLMSSSSFGLEEIGNEIVDLFRDSIQEAIYDVSDETMTWYERTNAFKDSVDIKIEGDNLFVFVNTEKLNYYSYINFVKTDNDISDSLPYWLEHGHHGSYGSGMYRNYSGRNYLELAYEKVRSKYPSLKLEIIDDPI